MKDAVRQEVLDAAKMSVQTGRAIPLPLKSKVR